MARRFEHNDIARTQRVLQALLPEGVSVSTSAIRDGWELSVVICGKRSCHTYDFSGSLADKHLLYVAETWATGEKVEPVTVGDVSETHAKALASPMVKNRNELTAWCRGAKRTEKVIYYRGELSRFRFDAPRRLVALQTLSDKAKRSRPRPVNERLEMAGLQETLDLLDGINKLHTASVIELVQHKLADGSGATYYAVKR